MPILNRTAELLPTWKGWRHHLHTIPELGFEEEKTSNFIAQQLEAMGLEVHRGLGGTGLVAVIEGKLPCPTPRAIGLRADMDALPVEEDSGVAYRSQHPGRMHACGHDGHSSMLLGAAQILAERRNFAGKVYLIFQPAEEGQAGAHAMIEDGLFQRFPMDQVFALHNLPGLALGSFAMCKGPIMASADTFSLRLEGVGGHAAMPHNCADPVVALAQVIVAAQSLVARRVNPLDSAVLSFCQLEAGHASNVIPNQASAKGTVRSLKPETRAAVTRALEEMALGMAASMGVSARLSWDTDGYPPTCNHDAETDLAARVARDLVGPEQVNTQAPPLMAAEDFSFMLNACPGAYIFLGNGDSAGLHAPQYVFNDEAMPYGVSYFVTLAETALAE